MVQGENELSLTGINLAALVMDGFEAKEFFEPLHALEQAGATVNVISANRGKVQGLDGDTPAQQLDVHATFDEADPQEFIAVLLPGGAKNAQALSAHSEARQFLREISDSGKPIAAICHGIALLVEADAVRGKTVTGHPDLKAAVVKAGGNWTDTDVMVDGPLTTGRGKEDLPAFIEATVTALHAYVHQHVAGTRDENAEVGPSS